jgi:hypothetical protein
MNHPTPRTEQSTVVVEPPSAERGAWAGAPSAVVVDGMTYLAYRLRKPEGQGRGYLNVVARSRDGIHFETLAELRREGFGAESLERPALVRSRDGRWRLYVSAATPGSKHWRIDLLEADAPEGFDARSARTVLAGSECVGVKDPVLLQENGTWHLWASCHPLNDADHTDRMSTHYATSPDGRDWTWHGRVLAGRPGTWNQRGVRVTSVLLEGTTLLAAYDGRSSPAQNWEEQTGTASGRLRASGLFTELSADDREPVASPHPPHGLRYLTVVPAGDGLLRLYYEVTRPDGAHELRCGLSARPTPRDS